MRHFRVHSHHHQEEFKQHVRPQDVLPLLRTATADLRTACVNALRIAEAFITRVNTTRWTKSAEPEPDIDGHLDELRRAIDDFKQNRRLEVLVPFKHFASPDKDESSLPRRALFYAFVFQANLVWCADAIVQLLEVLAETANKRPKARLWAPKSLRSLWKILTMRSQSKAAALGGDTLSVDESEAERSEIPDSKQDVFLCYDCTITLALMESTILIAALLRTCFNMSVPSFTDVVNGVQPQKLSWVSLNYLHPRLDAMDVPVRFQVYIHQYCFMVARSLQHQRL